MPSRWSEFGFPNVLGLPITTPLLGLWLAIKERVEKLEMPFKVAGSSADIQDLNNITYDDLLGVAFRGRNYGLHLDDYSLAACVGHFLYWFYNDYLRNMTTATSYFTNFRLFMMNGVGDPNDLVNITWDDFTAWFTAYYGIPYDQALGSFASYSNNLPSYDSLYLLYRLINRIHYTSTERIRSYAKKGNTASYKHVDAYEDADHTAQENAISAILAMDWTTYTLSADNDRQLPDAWNVTQLGSFGQQIYSSTEYPRSCTITQRWLLDGTNGGYDGFGYPLTGDPMPATAYFGINWISPSYSWPSGPVFPDMQPWRVPNSGWYACPFVSSEWGYFANPLSGTYPNADGVWNTRRIGLQWNDVIVDASSKLDFYDPE